MGKYARTIMLVDMNSYFATAEQQAHPHLRGKPVGVCAYLGKNGCVIAASIEAKKRGAYTAMRVFEAKRMIPDMIFIENNPDRYRSITKKIYTILADYSDRVDHYSIDESFLDLTGWAKTYDQALIIGREIKDRIQNEVGEWLRCSVGIGPSRFVAKLATDLDKPDGLMAIKQSELEWAYSQVELTDAWGINKGIAKRLYALGIYDLNDLKNYPVMNLIQALGKHGYYLWAKVNGLEVSAKHTEKLPPKSIGHTYCIPKRTTDKEYLISTLSKLCERAGQRLIKDGRWAYGYSCGWGYVDHPGYWHSVKLDQPIKSSWDIMQYACGDLQKFILPDNVNFLGVCVWDLNPPTGQLSFFPTSRPESKVGPAIDQITSRYGSDAVIWGRMWGTQDRALDRIGFRKTVDLD